MEQVRVSSLEIEELACKIVGLDYDEIDADEVLIEDKLMEEFNIDLSLFSSLIGRLLPLVNVAKSDLTGIWYKGFADTKNKLWLVKTEIDE